MFVFENLLDLEDRAIQLLLKEVESETLIVVAEGRAARRCARSSSRTCRSAPPKCSREDLDSRGPVRVSEVETAAAQDPADRAQSRRKRPDPARRQGARTRMSDAARAQKPTLSAYQRWEMASFDPVTVDTSAADQAALEAHLRRVQRRRARARAGVGPRRGPGDGLSGRLRTRPRARVSRTAASRRSPKPRASPISPTRSRPRCRPPTRGRANR